MDIKKLSDNCQCIHCRFRKAPTVAGKKEAAREMLADCWVLGARPAVVRALQGVLSTEPKDISYLEGGIEALKYAGTGMAEEGIDPSKVHLDSILAAFLREWLRMAGEDPGEMPKKEEHWEEELLSKLMAMMGMTAFVVGESGKVERLGTVARREEREKEEEWPDEVEGA